MGGRRKKGIKEKIKEKLPGCHKDEQQSMATGGHNDELTVVLDVLPLASLRLSHDAAGHLKLLSAQCRRRAPV